jgi:RTX calcium-binding nonapeptide repeat (4 copies)
MPPPIPTIPSPRNDQITGTSADDIIDALAGNDVVRAGDGDDVVLGNRGNDKLFGEDGSDRLSGDQGNDDIDGGDGLDTAVYTGSRDDYQVTTDANGVTEVKDLRGQGSKTPDGIDHVSNVEFLEFTDGTFRLQDGVLVPISTVFDLNEGGTFEATPFADTFVLDFATFDDNVTFNIIGFDPAQDQIFLDGPLLPDALDYGIDISETDAGTQMSISQVLITGQFFAAQGLVLDQNNVIINGGDLSPNGTSAFDL